MINIDWDSLPTNANWVAMDGDGVWFWYQKKPSLCSDDSNFNVWGLQDPDSDCGQMRTLGNICIDVASEDSLQKRPARSLEDLIADEDPQVVDGAIAAMQRMGISFKRTLEDPYDDFEDDDDDDDDDGEEEFLRSLGDEQIELNSNLLRAADRNREMFGSVDHPAHYTDGRKYEVIDVIEENVFRAKDAELGFLQGQVLKYLMRMWDKDTPMENVGKALWYLNRLNNKMENS